MCNKFWNGSLCLRTAPNFSSYSLVDHCGEELRCLIHPKGLQIVQQICHSMTIKIRSEHEGNMWKLFGVEAVVLRLVGLVEFVDPFIIVLLTLTFWMLGFPLKVLGHSSVRILWVNPPCIELQCFIFSQRSSCSGVMWFHLRRSETSRMYIFLKEFQAGKIWRSPRCFLLGDLDNDLIGGLHQFCLIVDKISI